MGDPGLLYPKDMNIMDVPSELITAVEQALKILSWQENLPSDEMPKQWMWTLDWELENWFEKIKEAREEKYGSSKSDNYKPSDDAKDDNVFIDRFKGK